MSVFKMLVVEDEVATREALGAMLRAEGYDVCFAWSAAGAVKALTIEKPDLVLLDVDLGEEELSGIDVARLMSGDERWRRIPVIVTSGLPSEEIRARARTNAFEGLRTIMLPKPIDLGALAEEIGRMLASGP
jgi:CheY-like chemotaxis protein